MNTQRMSDPILLPCPAGHPAVLASDRGISCVASTCWWMFPSWGCKDDAALCAAWNRRVPAGETALREAYAALRTRYAVLAETADWLATADAAHLEDARARLREALHASPLPEGEGEGETPC